MRKLLVVTVAALLAACQTSPVRPVPPTPQLLSSAPLELPADCRAGSSFVVKFAIAANGATSNIQPSPGAECVQAALAAWVASFRYAPQAAEIPMAIEWLMVEARQGS